MITVFSLQDSVTWLPSKSATKRHKVWLLLFVNICCSNFKKESISQAVELVVVLKAD